MTFCKGATPHRCWHLSKCHWLVNDTFWKLSLTGQWRFVKVHPPTGVDTFQNVIYRSMTFCKGAPPHRCRHLSKCHWAVNKPNLLHSSISRDLMQFVWAYKILWRPCSTSNCGFIHTRNLGNQYPLRLVSKEFLKQLGSCCLLAAVDGFHCLHFVGLWYIAVVGVFSPASTPQVVSE